MGFLASRTARIKPSASSGAAQRARELRAAGRDIVNLGQGEPDFPTPDHIIEAATKAMRAGETRYTDTDGTPQLKEAVAAKFLRENGSPSIYDKRNKYRLRRQAGHFQRPDGHARRWATKW